MEQYKTSDLMSAFNHALMDLAKPSEYFEALCSDNKLFEMFPDVHDFGKIVSTEEINGVIYAYNHETMGLSIIKAFLDRLTDNDGFKEYVQG